MPWANLTQPQAVLFAAAVGAGGAILGGVVAAFITQLVGASGQRRRQWSEARHVAYAKVTETFHAAWGLYDEVGRLRVDRPTMRRASGELFAAYSRAVLLTRRTATATALENLHDVAQQLWDRSGRSWDDVDDACRDAEWTFRREARVDLGLSGRRGLPKRTPPPRQPVTGAPQPAITDDGGADPVVAGGAESVNDSFTANVPSDAEAQR